MIVFEGGLLTEGTEAQKFYYLEEQMAMDMNLPNLENVYKLLESCNSFIPKEQIEAFQNSLYTKNKNWIESHEFNNATTKKERLDKLNLLHQNAQTHTTKFKLINFAQILKCTIFLMVHFLLYQTQKINFTNSFKKSNFAFL